MRRRWLRLRFRTAILIRPVSTASAGILPALPAGPQTGEDTVADVTGIRMPSDFSGVVSVRRGETVEFEQAFGLALRAPAVPVRPDTQFAIASGTKGITATVIVSLVATGSLAFSTQARSLLGRDLPLVGDDVTIEHLLTHTSGIGDYCDEDLDPIPPPSVPYGELTSTAAYLPVLDGYPAKFAPGARFCYSNGGYVLLALLAERATGTPFESLVATVVTAPAGMVDTAFLRADDLPARAAVGYLENGRTNKFAIPAAGSGDGGIFTTAADVHRFWAALIGGRLVPDRLVARMGSATSERYGMGLWLDPPLLDLHGGDNGVSFRTYHDPTSGATASVLCNTGGGAWPVARQLRALLGGRASRTQP